MSEKYQSRDIEVFWRDPLPGFVLDSEITYFESPSYTVVVRNVDWKNLQFPTWIDSPISQPTSLIKYSMAEHSPVSENPTDYIQLGTPSYFRFVKAEQGSELMADELESAYVETLDWRKHGSSMMESMKDRFASSFLSVPNDARQKMKWTRDDVLIYCTSVAPETSYDRELHEESISSNYDFATRIVRPSCFAAELGHLFGKQIDYENDLSADLPGAAYACHASANTGALLRRVPHYCQSRFRALPTGRRNRDGHESAKQYWLQSNIAVLKEEDV